MSSEEINSEEERDLPHQIYLEYRKTLVEIESDQAKSLDKAVLTVASGALGLSILFGEKIAPNPPSFTIALYISWICFCMAMLSATFSFRLASLAAEKQRWMLDAHMQSGKRTGNNPYSTWVDRLNLVSPILLFLGACFLAFFAVVNYERRMEMIDAEARHPSTVEIQTASAAEATQQATLTCGSKGVL